MGMKGRANSLKHTEHKTFSDVSSSYDVQHRFECISQLGEGKIQILYYLNKAFHINLRVEFNNSIHAISLIYKINLESRINLHKFPCFVVVVFLTPPPPLFHSNGNKRAETANYFVYFVFISWKTPSKLCTWLKTLLGYRLLCFLAPFHP